MSSSNEPSGKNDNSVPKEIQDLERIRLSQELENWLEGPVQLLGLLWLVLLIVEFVWGLNPFLESLVYVIWSIFVLDFALRFVLAPHKPAFLKRNWLTVISLALPALRIFAIFRAARLLRLLRTLRGLHLVRIVSSLNRGMQTLRAYMGRRKFGYVIVLTLLVTVTGSAGMFAFERREVVEQGFTSFGDALWWTAMIITTLGSEYWPQTAEGRALGFLLALYAVSVFGYVTATLATYFIGQEARAAESDVVGATSIQALQAQIAALQLEIRELTTSIDRQNRQG